MQQILTTTARYHCNFLFTEDHIRLFLDGYKTMHVVPVHAHVNYQPGVEYVMDYVALKEGYTVGIRERFMIWTMKQEEKKNIVEIRFAYDEQVRSFEVSKAVWKQLKNCERVTGIRSYSFPFQMPAAICRHYGKITKVTFKNLHEMTLDDLQKYGILHQMNIRAPITQLNHTTLLSAIAFFAKQWRVQYKSKHRKFEQDPYCAFVEFEPTVDYEYHRLVPYNLRRREAARQRLQKMQQLEGDSYEQ